LLLVFLIVFLPFQLLLPPKFLLMRLLILLIYSYHFLIVIFFSSSSALCLCILSVFTVKVGKTTRNVFQKCVYSKEKENASSSTLT
jgi:hypothetical protein